MKEYSYDDMADLERRNWWYISRRRMVDSALRRIAPQQLDIILDVGCGVGSNFPVLKAHAKSVWGLDLSPRALHYAKHCGYDRLIEANAESIPLPDESVEAVVCMDVLEHVDDEKAVREIVRVLKEDGYALINVPAFVSLWNENDDYSHHLRRYRKKGFTELFVRNGLVPRRISFWNISLFPAVWLAARLYRRDESRTRTMQNNLYRIPSFMNPILIRVVAIERLITRWISIPFGVSLWAVAHKR